MDKLRGMGKKWELENGTYFKAMNPGHNFTDCGAHDASVWCAENVGFPQNKYLIQ